MDKSVGAPGKMKLAITITTYNRPKEFFVQLNELWHQLEVGGLDAEILVVNDGSLKSYKEVEKMLEDMPYHTEYDRFVTNQGKKYHWRVMQHCFNWLKQREFDYALHLQDDLLLPEDFLEELLYHFNAIKHPKKVCLNYVLEESRVGIAVWTPVSPVHYHIDDLTLYRVGWVELHYIANRQFFEALNWHLHPIGESRWEQNPLLSSGVGRQISKRLFNKGLSMWQVTSSLAVHGTMKSYMNPNERKINKLRSI